MKCARTSVLREYKIFQRNQTSPLPTTNRYFFIYLTLLNVGSKIWGKISYFLNADSSVRRGNEFNL